MIGEHGLVQALKDEGLVPLLFLFASLFFLPLFSPGHTIANSNVDYVIVGETREYNYDLITKAAEHVRRGAKLIGANKDIRDRVILNFIQVFKRLFIVLLQMHAGFVPATGALITPIELTSDRKVGEEERFQPYMAKLITFHTGIFCWEAKPHNHDPCYQKI